jgi:trehalose-phosphatase
MQQVLHALTRHQQYRVAIVSGRSLADLRQRVPVQAMYLAGNHGLEIDGPVGHFVHPQAQRLRPQFAELRQALQRDLEEIPGVLVEDKGLTLSVHFRRVPEALVPEVNSRVMRGVAPAIDAGLCVLRTGKAVFEVRPRMPWDKGEAVRWVLARLRLETPSARVLPLYLGDDETDEDAFRILAADGIGIVVGRDRSPSMAHYYLDSTEDAVQFLSILSELSWAGV